MTVRVREIREIDDALVDALNRLIPQLSSSATTLRASDVERIVSDSGTTLFVAERDDKIVGTLTLHVFETATGCRAWIEDVVVDESARRQGVADQLTGAALERAQQLGARTVDLTSRPTREAANRLYERLGFERRDTNVYRKSVSDR